MYIFVAAVCVVAYFLIDWALYRTSASYRSSAFRAQALAELEKEQKERRENEITKRVRHKEYDYQE